MVIGENASSLCALLSKSPSSNPPDSQILSSFADSPRLGTQRHTKLQYIRSIPIREHNDAYMDVYSLRQEFQLPRKALCQNVDE